MKSSEWITLWVYVLFYVRIHLTGVVSPVNLVVWIKSWMLLRTGLIVRASKNWRRFFESEAVAAEC